jgi:hypothetical protein
MTQQLLSSKPQISLYEYFGIEVFFLSSDTQPLVVYGEFQSRKSKIMIQLENGVFSHLIVMNVDNCQPLETKELDKFTKVVSNNLTEIIKSWTNHYIYHKHIPFEKISKPIL